MMELWRCAPDRAFDRVALSGCRFGDGDVDARVPIEANVLTWPRERWVPQRRHVQEKLPSAPGSRHVGPGRSLA